MDIKLTSSRIKSWYWHAHEAMNRKLGFMRYRENICCKVCIKNMQINAMQQVAFAVQKSESATLIKNRFSIFDFVLPEGQMQLVVFAYFSYRIDNINVIVEHNRA